MARRGKHPKKVVYELIDRGGVVGHPMYALLDDLVHRYHKDLRPARIALAWCKSWKPDVDGRVTLGKCKRASDLDREMAQFDFIILLRRTFWIDSRVTDLQRTALLDHELCHAARKFDPNGEPVEDERGRPVFRTRKHDIEEFADVVARYGIWQSDVENFAAALRRGMLKRPFEPCSECAGGRPGWIEFIDEQHNKRVKRCDCWIQWSELRGEMQAEAAHA